MMPLVQLSPHFEFREQPLFTIAGRYLLIIKGAFDHDLQGQDLRLQVQMRALIGPQLTIKRGF